ncbi:Mannose-6-phosphate isomerase [Modestobacter italicus]|uniref:Mannose-6-phosphate isomerase n=1 Tax=Modestobacter italicus (strain DSM 44449 / CECT 9708 / BC 501) TaxID=2732864 RepID=I4EU47_MODI5|nr:class I mannose-6-phosphate isomerase [Modestobacter marinus]CCH86910.1 Mannose-6-phosphate isomerase [Modestobacter marinus]
MPLVPLTLDPNQPADRFYAGGARIAEFRGTPWVGGNLPEDWVGSSTTLFGEHELGLTRLPDGRLLRDVVAADPVGWLGAAHVARFGADTMLLTKLLDAGQRLPVHLHPDGAFAAEHLQRAHGKTEAWVVLRGGEVHLGLRRDLAPAEVRRLVAEQDVEVLLAAMHRVEVAPGDAVLVPAGLPHAIGAGVLLVEVQEPEDLSILLEWRGFALDGERDGHLGLGFDLALQAADLSGWSPERIDSLVVRRRGPGPVLPERAAEFFRVDRVLGGDPLAASFGVVVVTRGQGRLRAADDGWTATVGAGQTLLVPHGAGALALDGDVEALWCRPPQAG